MRRIVILSDSEESSRHTSTVGKSEGSASLRITVEAHIVIVMPSVAEASEMSSWTYAPIAFMVNGRRTRRAFLNLLLPDHREVEAVVSVKSDE